MSLLRVPLELFEFVTVKIVLQGRNLNKMLNFCVCPRVSQTEYQNYCKTTTF